jgi:hypothetical protein
MNETPPAAYRSSREQQSKNSNSSATAEKTTVRKNFEHLIAMGLVVKFRDEYGIERYRSTRVVR